ncbi:MAG: enoyl-CoA hydratase/isomerase family protein, partial [Myxococcota bacterium]|nr:enoyl-CoA hydratase/isomerase family protein [Myxococcota bacterium]
PEVKLGFPVGWGGTQRLSSVIGASATKHLTLECETLSAQQALHLGLIHRHFQDNFHEGAQEALGRLTPTPASTLRYTKSQFHAIETGSFDADRDAQAILKAGQNAEVLAHATANWRAKKTTYSTLLVLDAIPHPSSKQTGVSRHGGFILNKVRSCLSTPAGVRPTGIHDLTSELTRYGGQSYHRPRPQGTFDKEAFI